MFCRLCLKPDKPVSYPFAWVSRWIHRMTLCSPCRRLLGDTARACVASKLPRSNPKKRVGRAADVACAAAAEEHKIVYGLDLHKMRRPLRKTIVRMRMRASSGIVPRAAPKEGLSQDACTFYYNLPREFSWSNAAVVLYTS